MTFNDKLNKIIGKNNSLLCIGLDTDIKKIPQHLLAQEDPIFTFNKAIIDSTFDLVCAYKPNMAFYEAMGIDGLKSLKKTIKYLADKYPQIPTICDGKRGDIGSTSEKYAKSTFEYYGFDSITVNPYLGTDGIEPFLKYSDKGIIILCRTSNPGSVDFQDLNVKGKKLYQKVAEKIIQWDKSYHNCLMVIGATWPEELKQIRKMTSGMFFLVPGIGAQGGDTQKIMEYGLNNKKSGLIINVSRAIIYASKEKDFEKTVREKALEFNRKINKYRNG